MSVNFLEYMKFAISIILICFLVLVVWQWSSVSAVLDIFSTLSEEKQWSSRLKTPEDVLEYIVAHPKDVSLVAYKIGNSEKGIFYNSDEKRPLASTIKILVLAEYARQVELEIISPDELVNLADIDIYYLPNTDGGAHPNAVKELKEKAYINAANQVELRHIPWAMISYSDKAATDYLIERLGRDKLEKITASLQLNNQDVPLPIIGQFLSWSNHTFSNTPAERLNKYQAMRLKEYADEVYHWTNEWRSHQEFRAKETKQIKSRKGLKYQEQKAMTEATNCGGTARGYAQIMERIYSGSLISPQADEIIREYLEWPMQFPENQQQLDAFGAKGGSLAGIITEVWYLKPKKAQHARVAALFLKKIPGSVWFKMLQTYIQQEFQYKLLVDDKFFDLVREKLMNDQR
ncbi:hypothetical protein SD80_003700 [Scytonema tolypothrichoides VB-61278]|nr:hypothetical protein SD80_003700 [Scytonema tolypothrichoides VB-61278]